MLAAISIFAKVSLKRGQFLNRDLAEGDFFDIIAKLRPGCRGSAARSEAHIPGKRGDWRGSRYGQNGWQKMTISHGEKFKEIVGNGPRMLKRRSAAEVPSQS